MYAQTLFLIMFVFSKLRIQLCSKEIQLKLMLLEHNNAFDKGERVVEVSF
jgi:hypothetical protein